MAEMSRIPKLWNFLYRHQQSHEQIRPTEERRRVAVTIVTECDNNCFAHWTNDWVSNCERKRSFLRLSGARSHLRATTSQYRLDHLAVMIIESDFLRALDVTTLIYAFAHENENQQTNFFTKAGLFDPEHEGSLTLCYSIIQCGLSLHVSLPSHFITIIIYIHL